MSKAIAEIRTALRPTLMLLWVTWAVVLLGAIPIAFYSQSETYRIPGWCKMASSLILVLAAWTWYAALLGRPGVSLARRIAFLMTAGIAFGTLGDFFNAGRLQEIIPLPNPTVGGLGSFLVGHIFYITACVLLAKRCGLVDRKSWLIAVGFWEFVSIIGWYLIVYRGEGDVVLTWAALPYSMLLAGTAGVTAALALQEKRLTCLAIGGALFLISDLILGYGIFQGRLWPEGEPVWLTYGPGQMFIVFAIGAMVSLLPQDEEHV